MNNVKKILSVAICAASFSGFCGNEIAMANDSSPGAGNNMYGMYIGGQAGKIDLNYSGSDYLLATNSVSDQPLFWRFYVGYSFTDLLSAELGYDHYGRVGFKHNPTGNTQDMKQQGIDLLGKAYLPLDYGFGFYIKAGGTWIHRDSVAPCSGYFVDKRSNSRLVPTGALGLGYNFSPTWVADASLMTTLSSGDLPKTYFYGLGLTYKFGESTL